MSERRVLVVDDEDFIRDLVCDFFDCEGIQCDSAETMPTALELLRKYHYFLVLLDRNLESAKGEKVISHVRRIQPRIPVVILTGDHQFSSEEARRIEADGVIYKPFKIDEFMTSVEEFLETE